MPTSKIYEIIARSLAGEQNSSDEKVLDEWLKTSEDNRRVYEKIKTHWGNSTIKKYKIVGQEEVKEKVWNRAKGERSVRVNYKKSIIDRQWLLKIAASVAIVLMSLATVYFFLSKGTDNQSSAEYLYKENSAGRKSTLYLNDGTVVHLNSASSIRYPEVFSDTSRVVYLKGEAYFEVARDPAKPFSVISANVRTTALGTSFNVKAYDDSNDIEVSLVEGKVRVSEETATDGDRHYELSPGQRIAYSREKTQFTSVDFFDPKETLAWKDGVIFFKKADFGTIKKELERWFGCEIVVPSGQYPAMSYTGEFHNQNLENILQSIGFVNNFNFRMEDKKVFIRFDDVKN